MSAKKSPAAITPPGQKSAATKPLASLAIVDQTADELAVQLPAEAYAESAGRSAADAYSAWLLAGFIAAVTR